MSTDNNKKNNQPTKHTDNYWHKPMGKITIGVIGGTIVLLVSFAINHFIPPKKNAELPTKQQVEQQIKAPNSVISIGQQGGITADTVNVNEFPEPKFDLKLISANVAQSGLFETKALLIIDSKTALKNLYLEVRAPSIVSLDADSQRTGMSIIGHSGKRDGFAFTNLPGAWGKYMLIILSQRPEKYEIIYDYK